MRSLKFLLIFSFIGLLIGSDLWAAKPTTQSRFAAFRNITHNSVDISWINGNGQRRLVLIKEASSINTLAWDGIGGEDVDLPSANSNFSSAVETLCSNSVCQAKLVFLSGSGRSVSVSGLSPNTTYTVHVMDANLNGSNFDILSSTASSNPRSFTTATAVPESLMVNVCGRTANMQWSVNPNDNAAEYFVDVAYNSSWNGDEDMTTTLFENNIVDDYNNINVGTLNNGNPELFEAYFEETGHYYFRVRSRLNGSYSAYSNFGGFEISNINAPKFSSAYLASASDIESIQCAANNAKTNKYIDIYFTADEVSRFASCSTGVLTLDQLSIEFEQNGGTATGITNLNLQRRTEYFGGDIEYYRLSYSVQGRVMGNQHERIVVTPADHWSIFASGIPMDEDQSITVYLRTATVLNHNTGYSYVTIQEAVDAAGNGHTIELLNGTTYNENVSYNGNSGFTITDEGEGENAILSGSFTYEGQADCITCIQYNEFFNYPTLNINGITLESNDVCEDNNPEYVVNVSGAWLNLTDNNISYMPGKTGVKLNGTFEEINITTNNFQRSDDNLNQSIGVDFACLFLKGGVNINENNFGVAEGGEGEHVSVNSDVAINFAPIGFGVGGLPGGPNEEFYFNANINGNSFSADFLGTAVYMNDLNCDASQKLYESITVNGNTFNNPNYAIGFPETFTHHSLVPAILLTSDYEDSEETENTYSDDNLGFTSGYYHDGQPGPGIDEGREFTNALILFPAPVIRSQNPEPDVNSVTYWTIGAAYDEVEDLDWILVMNGRTYPETLDMEATEEKSFYLEAKTNSAVIDGYIKVAVDNGAFMEINNFTLQTSILSLEPNNDQIATLNVNKLSGEGSYLGINGNTFNVNYAGIYFKDDSGDMANTMLNSDASVDIDGNEFVLLNDDNNTFNVVVGLFVPTSFHGLANIEFNSFYLNEVESSTNKHFGILGYNPLNPTDNGELNIRGNYFSDDLLDEEITEERWTNKGTAIAFFNYSNASQTSMTINIDDENSFDNAGYAIANYGLNNDGGLQYEFAGVGGLPVSINLNEFAPNLFGENNLGFFGFGYFNDTFQGDNTQLNQHTAVRLDFADGAYVIYPNLQNAYNSKVEEMECVPMYVAHGTYPQDLVANGQWICEIVGIGDGDNTMCGTTDHFETMNNEDEPVSMLADSYKLELYHQIGSSNFTAERVELKANASLMGDAHRFVRCGGEIKIMGSSDTEIAISDDAEIEKDNVSIYGDYIEYSFYNGTLNLTGEGVLVSFITFGSANAKSVIMNSKKSKVDYCIFNMNINNPAIEILEAGLGEYSNIARRTNEDEGDGVRIISSTFNNNLEDSNQPAIFVRSIGNEGGYVQIGNNTFNMNNGGASVPTVDNFSGAKRAIQVKASNEAEDYVGELRIIGNSFYANNCNPTNSTIGILFTNLYDDEYANWGYINIGDNTFENDGWAMWIQRDICDRMPSSIDFASAYFGDGIPAEDLNSNQMTSSNLVSVYPIKGAYFDLPINMAAYASPDCTPPYTTTGNIADFTALEGNVKEGYYNSSNDGVEVEVTLEDKDQSLVHGFIQLQYRTRAMNGEYGDTWENMGSLYTITQADVDAGKKTFGFTDNDFVGFVDDLNYIQVRAVVTDMAGYEVEFDNYRELFRDETPINLEITSPQHNAIMSTFSQFQGNYLTGVQDDLFVLEFEVVKSNDGTNGNYTLYYHKGADEFTGTWEEEDPKWNTVENIDSPLEEQWNENIIVDENWYRVRVRAVDEAGNISEIGNLGSTTNRAFRIDQTPPTVTKVERTGNNTLVVTFSEEVQLSTAQNVANYSAIDSYKTPITFTSAVRGVELTSNIVTLTTSQNLSDIGRCDEITVRVINVRDIALNLIDNDNKGNVGTWVEPDLTAPTLTSINRQSPMNQGPWNNSTVTFRVMFDEDVQGVDEDDFAPFVTAGSCTTSVASVSMVDGDKSTYDVVVNVSGAADNTYLRLDIAEGATITDIQCEKSDVASNALVVPSGGIAGDETYHMDQTAPVITTLTIISNNAKNTNFAKQGDVVTVTATANENLAETGGMSNFVGGGSVASWSTSGTNATRQATHTVVATTLEEEVEFSFRLTDLAGNFADFDNDDISNSSSVIVDYTNPIVGITVPINNAKVNGVTAVDFNVTDVNPDPDDVTAQVTFDGGDNWHTIESGDLLEDFQQFNDFPDGEFLMSIRHEDKAGNMSSTVNRTLFKDNTGPVLADIEEPVAIACNNTTMTIVFDEPVYRDTDKTGALRKTNEIIVTKNGGNATLNNYTVSHTAGSTTVNVTLTWGGSINGGESVAVTLGASIYDELGNERTPVSFADLTGRSMTTNVSPVVTTQPVAPTAVCNGDGERVLNFAVVGTDLEIQWQYNPEGEWVAVPNDATHEGVTINSLTITDPSIDLDGVQYRAYIENTKGCGFTTTNALTLSVIPDVAVTTQPENKQICSGSNTSMTVSTNQNAAAAFQWQVSTNSGTDWVNVANGTPAGANYAATGQNQTLNINGATASAWYRVVVEGECGPNVNSNHAVLSVEAIAVAGAITKSPNSEAVCEGTSVSATFAANSGGNGSDVYEVRTQTLADGWSEWTAYTSGNAIPTEDLTGVQIRNTREADVCDADVETATWIVNPIPGTPTADDVTACAENVPATLSASGISGATIRWYSGVDGNNLPTGLLFTGDSYTHGQTAAGTYTYYVTQTKDDCPSTYKTVTLTIEATPVAGTLVKGEGVNTDAVCSGTEVSASIGNMGSGGNGNSDIEFRTQTGSMWSEWATYFESEDIETEGLTAVEIRITRLADECESASNTISWNVNPIPAAPTAESMEVCADDIPELEVSGADGATFTWYDELMEFADNGASFDTQLTMPGEYTYYVTQTLNGCESEPTQVNLFIEGVAVAGDLVKGIDVDADAVCSGTEVSATLDNEGSGGNGTIYLESRIKIMGEWDPWMEYQPGNIIMTASAEEVEVRVIRDATYCTADENVVSWIVNPIPNNPMVEDVNACVGSVPEFLTATGDDANGTINWYADMQKTEYLDSGEEYAHGETAQGQYFYYVAQEVNGCESPAIQVVLTIDPQSEAPFVAENGNVYCGTTVPASFSATEFENGATIKWYSDEQLTNLVHTGVSLTHGQSNANTYVYYVTQTTGACESMSFEFEFTINETPSAPTANNVSYCTGENPIDLVASGEQGATFRWYDDAELTNEVNVGAAYMHNITAAGTYTFYVTQENVDCASEATMVTLTVTEVPAAPTANNVSYDFGGNEPLTASGVNGATFTWYEDEDLEVALDEGDTYEHGETAIGTYTYYVTQSVNGCESEATMVTLTINPIVPTKLQIATINNQVSGTAFNVVVNAVNAADVAGNVDEETEVTLNVQTGQGTLTGTGTIPANGSSATISATYTNNNGETGVVLGASVTSGMQLTAATSNSFNVSGVAPGTQATTVDFTNVEQFQVTVSWTRGDGASVMLVARERFAVNGLPVNGTAYTGNSAWGQGSNIANGTANNYVVYSGTGTSVTVTGLTQGTRYHFRAFEFNGSGTTTLYNTNTASGNPRNTQTAPKLADGEEYRNVDGYWMSNIYPQPVKENVSFDIYLPEENMMTIQLFSETGALIAEPIVNRTFSAGVSHISFNLPNTIASGTYTLGIRIGDEFIIDRIVVSK